MTHPYTPFAEVDFSLIDQRIFYPRRDPHTRPPVGAEDHSFPVEPGIEIGSRFYLAEPSGPHLLFFHGNGEIASDYDDIGPLYNRLGLSLLVADYRGYGKSQGTPSVSTLLPDALAVFDQVLDWRKAQQRTGPFLVMGRSLGSAPAIEIAYRRKDKIAALILDSAFAYSLPLLQLLGIPAEALGLREEDGFKNYEKIFFISKPTLLIAGQQDDLIPPSESETLLQNSGAHRKELVLLPAPGTTISSPAAGKVTLRWYPRFVKPFMRKQKK